MHILIMWDVHSSIEWVLQSVGYGMGHYLHMEQVGSEDTKVSSLGLPRPLCDVPLLSSCLSNGLNEQFSFSYSMLNR